jgi:hypothetical protein
LEKNSCRKLLQKSEKNPPDVLLQIFITFLGVSLHDGLTQKMKKKIELLLGLRDSKKGTDVHMSLLLGFLLVPLALRWTG